MLCVVAANRKWKCNYCGARWYHFVSEKLDCCCDLWKTNTHTHCMWWRKTLHSLHEQWVTPEYVVSIWDRDTRIRAAAATATSVNEIGKMYIWFLHCVSVNRAQSNILCQLCLHCNIKDSGISSLNDECCVSVMCKVFIFRIRFIWRCEEERTKRKIEFDVSDIDGVDRDASTRRL